MFKIIKDFSVSSSKCPECSTKSRVANAFFVFRRENSENPHPRHPCLVCFPCVGRYTGLNINFMSFF